MLRFLTAGESHGPELTGILEGIPAGLEISSDYIDLHLARRQTGHGRGERMNIERDQVKITAGVRFGRTLGSPIALRIPNRDWPNWEKTMAAGSMEEEPSRVTLPRPGHADYAGGIKYGHTGDLRNILERASARETAMRVAVGTVARCLLEEFGILIGSAVKRIGDVEAGDLFSGDYQSAPDPAAIDLSPVRCPDSNAETAMIEAIDRAREAGDTLGGVFEVWAENVPIGLGSHIQWDQKIDGRLARAVMSIPACKGVEIGPAFESAGCPGSTIHDEFTLARDSGGEKRVQRRSNHAGGIEGGMTNGELVVIRAAMKPLASLQAPLRSVDLATGAEEDAHIERSDTCVVPAAGVVAEAVVALTLCAALLEKFGGDTLDDLRASVTSYHSRTNLTF